MKKLLILPLLFKTLFASTLLVEDGNVTISLDDANISLLVGETLDLEKEVKVCYLLGEGRVIIDEDTSLSKKSSNKCYTMQKDKEIGLKKYLQELNKTLVTLFFQNSKTSSISTVFRGGKKEKYTGVITLNQNETDFVIKSNSWSAYPITLSVYDSLENEVYSKTKYIDDDEDTMVFRLKRSQLSNKYRVKVRDKDGKEYIDVEVVLK